MRLYMYVLIHSYFQIAYEVLNMSISLTEDQIRDLANQINDKIRELDNIDVILNNTRADLERANALERRANEAKCV